MKGRVQYMNNNEIERNILQPEEYMVPQIVENEIDLKRYNKIPIGEIASLGVGMTSLTTAVTSITTGAGGTGLYWVSVPNDGTLMTFKDGSGYLGSAKAANGGVGGGQARLNQMPCDPTMIFMAATMFCINMKLDTIQETQEEILQFLEQKEKSELKGNILILSDIIDKYKYNWNNEQYLSNNHMKVIDIKQKSEQSILFAQARVKSTLGKKKLIQLNADVGTKVRNLNQILEDYQLAMYTYAMSQYVETMLLRNFDKGYMDSVASKIEDYSITYRELYTDCYNTMLQLEDKAVDKIILEGLGRISKATGEAMAKVPALSKSEVDEKLVALSEIIDDSEERVRKERRSSLIPKHSSYVTPFIDNIKMIGELHDRPLMMLFDEDNIYFKKVAS